MLAHRASDHDRVSVRMKIRQKRAWAWFERQTAANPALSLALFLGAVVAVLLVLLISQIARTNRIATRTNVVAARAAMLSERLVTDELKSCQIQARGLPISHELTQIFLDVKPLIVPTPAENRQLPPAVRRAVQQLSADLDTYTTAEDKQPATRNCGRVTALDN